MNKTYIFDSSTLILLAKITLLRTFAKNNSIIVPSTVRKEVLFKKENDDTKIIMNLIQENIILEKTCNGKKIMEEFNLGIGEGEAIELALKGKLHIATDDWRAIKACKVLDIKFVTAIHCLIWLRKYGELDKRIALEKLRNLEKYGRYTVEIIKDARRIIEGDNHD